MVLSDDSGLQVDVLEVYQEFGLRALLVPMLRMLKIMLNYCTSWLWCLMIANVLVNFHTTLVVAAPGRDSLVVDADWKGLYWPRTER